MESKIMEKKIKTALFSTAALAALVMGMTAAEARHRTGCPQPRATHRVFSHGRYVQEPVYLQDQPSTNTTIYRDRHLYHDGDHYIRDRHHDGDDGVRYDGDGDRKRDGSFGDRLWLKLHRDQRDRDTNVNTGGGRGEKGDRGEGSEPRDQGVKTPEPKQAPLPVDRPKHERIPAPLAPSGGVKPQDNVKPEGGMDKKQRHEERGENKQQRHEEKGHEDKGGKEDQGGKHQMLPGQQD